MRILFILAAVVLAIGRSQGASTIDPVNRYSYGGNIGWMDWRADSTHGAVIGEYVCSGYVYAANAGWISLGDGAPADGVRYRNNSATSYGVNHDGGGNLSGFAYGANIGWLIFTNRDATGAAYDGPRVNLRNGVLSGWIYGANVGWISLNSETGFVQTQHLEPGPDTDHDGLADPWELVQTGSLTSLGATGDADGDGISDLAEYLADTHPLDARSGLWMETTPEMGTNGTITLTWAAKPTRLYRIQRRADLHPATPWTDAGFGLIAPTSTTTLSRKFRHSRLGQGFFRIEAIVPTGEPPTLPPVVIAPQGCGLTVTPDVATDGQTVEVTGPGLQAGAHVWLAGYRYDIAPPTSYRPLGEGRVRIFCRCIALEGTGPKFSFAIPLEAPSAAYTVRLLPPGASCDSATCPNDDCPTPDLFVTPSYIVTTLEQMNVHGNGEKYGERPSEMSFNFASYAGSPFMTIAGTFAAPIEFSGHYPGGIHGSGHLTGADNTTFYPRLPIFIGEERLMLQSECAEEVLSYPMERQPEQRAYCAEASRFNGRFEFAFAGIEWDESASPWWGYAAGVGAAALQCLFANCDPSAATLGQNVAKRVNAALAEYDDYFGQYSEVVPYNPFSEWGLGRHGPFSLVGADEDVKVSGGGNGVGPIEISVEHRRIGAPRLLECRVTLESVTVLEPYSCQEPNQVFVNARAYRHRPNERQLINTTRLPSDTGNWPIWTGQTRNFSPVLLINNDGSDPAASESPLLYIEFGVWEQDDGSDDLMGLHSETIFLADFLTSGAGEVIDDINEDGFFVRRVSQQRDVTVNGFAGSDVCVVAGQPFAAPTYPAGRVRLRYKVEATWLKQVSR